MREETAHTTVQLLLDAVDLDLPAGSYTVQAVLHKYETFHRSDGHVVKLPMDRGEGQQWSRAPGNRLTLSARNKSRPAVPT